MDTKKLKNVIQLKLSNPQRRTTLKSVGKIAAALGVEPVDLLED